MKKITIAFICVALLQFAIAGCGDKTPHAPSNLVITSTAPITLSWHADISPTSYNIYRGTVSGGLSTKILLASNGTVDGKYPATTFTDMTATAGITYYYQVTAVNWDTESAASNEVSATP